MKPNRTNTKELTTNAGQPIIDNDHSLSAGERGEPRSACVQGWRQLACTSCRPCELRLQGRCCWRTCTCRRSLRSSTERGCARELCAACGSVPSRPCERTYCSSGHSTGADLGRATCQVPERVVHARGMTAKGYFEVTDAIPDLCCADMFSEVGGSLM